MGYNTNRRDLQTGKLSRQVSTGSLPADLRSGSSYPMKGKPARAVAVSSGTITYTGTDGVSVTTIDMGGPWQWDVDIETVTAADADFQAIW